MNTHIESTNTTTNTAKPALNREEWLTAMGEYIADDILDGIAAQLDLPPPPVRFSVGFAPRTKGGKVIGVCCPRHMSADGHNEIFISPAIDDSAQIAHVIVHELIHAYLDNEDGHRNRFVKMCKAAGLKAPYTATTPTDELAAQLDEYISVLGDIPAASVAIATVGKKQKNRQLKIACVECDFSFRTSQAMIDRLTADSACPCCDETGTLKQEIKLQAVHYGK